MAREHRMAAHGAHAHGNMQHEDDVALSAVSAIIGGDVEKLVKTARSIARMLVQKKVKSTQIRKAYTPIAGLTTYDEGAKRQLYMMLPRLAYQSKRHGGLAPLLKVCERAVELIDNSEKLEHFKDFFEAVVAYHRAEGGED